MEEKVLTHINDQGRAKMVDVGEKEKTKRIAKAFAKVRLNEETFNIVVNKKAKKGDVLAVAQVAGIMGAKKTSDIIPMCHPINLVGVDIEFNMNYENFEIEIIATTKCVGETGVEMEALSAVSITALTIYDMCKAVQRDIEITDIKLLEKSGGKSGDFIRGKDESFSS
ncbi:cyclic pyranopterin monophosphate synthase MoaC [Parvimonas parva]|uniref:Cyclic pyranopterin monophosphate synthase n=1 Tax=Parvimonas parva TaxID=2769485 RepID=A0ABS1C6Z4_9FIRM|nr:cyclic pyranopterin monophosphate synthase MoaC [Parvimonas parva]MBK1467718.1 cyclic pyranopterin monophosphate synthase MoaC [Parvimonas parva]